MSFHIVNQILGADRRVTILKKSLRRHVFVYLSNVEVHIVVLDQEGM